MCAIDPFVCAFCIRQGSLPVSLPRLSSSSSLYTHWNLCADFKPARFMRLRSADPSGQPRTFQNSATRICVESIFNAAPIDEKNTALVSQARIMSDILSFSESIASMI